MTYTQLLLALGALMLLGGCNAVEPAPCPQWCDGCCDASGSCQAGTATGACGSAGAQCLICSGPAVCVAGGCVGGFAGATGSGGITGAGGAGGVAGAGGAVGVGGAAGGPTGAGGQVGQGGQAGGQAGQGGQVGQGGSPGMGGAPGDSVVSGRATYEFVPSFYDPVTKTGGLRFNQSIFKPIRNASVIVLQGTTVLASAVTGEDGRYTLSYRRSGAAALQLGVIARTQSPPIQVEDNTDQNLAWSLGAPLPPGTTTLDLRATAGWQGSSYNAAQRTAAPFAILDSMLTAARAFMAVRTVNFPLLKVNWSPNNVPQSGSPATGRIGTSYYTSSENEIYVLGKDGADADEYDSHVIVHEWGHYFENNLARSDSPGGRHGPGDVLEPRIAFGEAWGNAVASMVLPETVYSDVSWRQGMMSAFGFDTETAPTPTDDPSPGGFSESSVLRLLYDLYDDSRAESFDAVALGLGPVYDVLVGPQKNTNAVTTIASFVTAVKALPGANVSAINSLMANYSIGAITSDFGDGDSGLRGMFTDAPLPYTGRIDLGGGFPANSWQQNQYYVFTGTGRPVTVSATSAQDVAIAALQRGRTVGSADANTAGTERFTFNSQSGAIYVVVLTGFTATRGDYTVALNFTSP